MKRIAIILLNNMDELAVIIPLYFWRSFGITIDLISLEKKNSVILSQNVKLYCTNLISSVNLSQYDVIYIPGGEGAKKLTYEDWPIKNSTELISKVAKGLITILKDKTHQKKLIMTNDSFHILDDLKIFQNQEQIYKITSELNEHVEKLLNFENNNLIVFKGQRTILNLINIVANFLVENEIHASALANFIKQFGL